MKAFKIKLGNTEDIKKFTETVAICNYDVDVSRDKYMIDGKSVLGLLSIDLSKPVDVLIHTEDKAEINRIKESLAGMIVA